MFCEALALWTPFKSADVVAGSIRPRVAVEILGRSALGGSFIDGNAVGFEMEVPCVEILE
jgi:hypothetical protein